jgi:uncharacterized membrane protein YccC
MHLKSFLNRDNVGLHYTVRIFIGTTVLWALLQKAGDANPLWAIISLIVVTEPRTGMAWLAFRARIINTLLGCVVGLIFLRLADAHAWVLGPSLTLTVFICTFGKRAPLGWRIAPITTAMIIAAGLEQANPIIALHVAVNRTLEVLLGSTMALLVTWGVSLVWEPAEEAKAEAEAQARALTDSKARRK